MTIVYNRKPRFIPVKIIPISFFMQSASTRLRPVNGFEIFRVANSFESSYFYVRGNNCWVIKK